MTEVEDVNAALLRRRHVGAEASALPVASALKNNATSSIFAAPAAAPAPVPAFATLKTSATPVPALLKTSALPSTPSRSIASSASRAAEKPEIDRCHLVILCAISIVFFLSGAALWVYSGGVQDDERAARQIQAIQTTFDVPLQLVFDGGVAQVPLPDGRQVICRGCGGSGAAPGHSHTCPHCSGRGYADHRIQFMPGFQQTVRQQCAHCRGAGVRVSKACPQCGGAKVEMERTASVRVLVPRGCLENEVLVVRDGHQVAGLGGSGVVHVRLRTAAHPVFERRGAHDLHARLRISLKEALLGFRREVRHLSGGIVTVERFGVTQPNTELHFVGEGLPVRNVTSSSSAAAAWWSAWWPTATTSRGDLFVSFALDMPDAQFVNAHGARLRDLLR